MLQAREEARARNASKANQSKTEIDDTTENVIDGLLSALTSNGPTGNVSFPKKTYLLFFR